MTGAGGRQRLGILDMHHEHWKNVKKYPKTYSLLLLLLCFLSACGGGSASNESATSSSLPPPVAVTPASPGSPSNPPIAPVVPIATTPPVSPTTPANPANGIRNDGDKFIVRYPAYVAGLVSEYRLYSMRKPDDPPRAMVDRSVSGLELTDPYVYDGVQAYYKVFAVVAGKEIEILKVNGVQPARSNWNDTPVVVTSNNMVLSGNYRSLKKNGCKTPITINAGVTGTVIENARIASCGDGINAQSGGNGITVRNTRGWGLHPETQNDVQGSFFNSGGHPVITIENNYMEGWHFDVAINGEAVQDKSRQKISIRYNRMRNLQGLLTNADGSYQKKRATGLKGGWGHPILLDKVQQSPATEIAWNEFIQESSIGWTEDVINLGNSSGTLASRSKIHDNVIFGAYAVEPGVAPPAGAAENYGWSSACGIISDGPGNALTHGNHDIDRNIVISTTNCGIGIASGSNIFVTNNRVTSSGLLEDGTHLWGQNIGIYVDKFSSGDLADITLSGNYMAWDRQAKTQHYSASSGLGDGNANFVPGRVNGFFKDINSSYGPRPISIQAERAEYQLFWSRIREAAVKIGISSHDTN